MDVVGAADNRHKSVNNPEKVNGFIAWLNLYVCMYNSCIELLFII